MSQQYVEDTSEKEQLQFVHNNPGNLLLMDNPSEKTIKYAIDQDPLIVWHLNVDYINDDILAYAVYRDISNISFFDTSDITYNLCNKISLNRCHMKQDFYITSSSYNFFVYYTYFTGKFDDVKAIFEIFDRYKYVSLVKDVKRLKNNFMDCDSETISESNSETNTKQNSVSSDSSNDELPTINLDCNNFCVLVENMTIDNTNNDNDTDNDTDNDNDEDYVYNSDTDEDSDNMECDYEYCESDNSKDSDYQYCESDEDVNDHFFDIDLKY